MGHLIAQTHHLNFSFSSSKKILHDLNLNIPQGSIYCFLGPNGAGKTTTLRLLLGLLKADQNAISIFDQQLFFNRMSILRRVGALIEEPSVYLHLTGRENLKIYRLSYSCGPWMVVLLTGKFSGPGYLMAYNCWSNVQSSSNQPCSWTKRWVGLNYLLKSSEYYLLSQNTFWIFLVFFAELGAIKLCVLCKFYLTVY